MLKKDVLAYSPLTLAFMGDAVYEQLVRERLVKMCNRDTAALHKLKIARVCASFQSKAVEALLPTLTEEETAVYKRGRNANSTAPKNADMTEYRRATGLEALLGYLFLLDENTRISELFEIIWNTEVSR